ncbi:MAG: hypothetical protein H0V90_04960 [Blastocatellia bacterium]|nr:hypothetical protein [Blastocatellia bacterium]
MIKDRDKETNRSIFFENLPFGFVTPKDHIELLLLSEYGALFVAKGGVVVPKSVVFKNSGEVSRFQAGLQKSTEDIGGFEMDLQSPAMTALIEAIDEAGRRDLSITPRYSDSAGRTYDETVGLWASRVQPALRHWVDNGEIDQADADRIEALTPYLQVPEVLKLETKGIFFAKDLSKSIIYSVAPPGTSQHLALLAFDVLEHEDPEVREILSNAGWFQTVTSDLPHFTYLGVRKNELEELGLKKVNNSDRSFWIPDI